MPSRLRWAHHGGAAVVWLPPEDEWQTGTTKILRLETPFSDVPGLGPYAYELMGAAMALILSARIHAHVTVVCIRAEEALSTRRRALGHRAKGVLLESIAATTDCTRFDHTRKDAPPTNLNGHMKTNVYTLQTQ